MARKPNPPAEIIDTPINQQAFEKGAQALNEVALMNVEIDENTRQLAAQLGYEGSLNPEALEAGINDSQARVGYELFAIGARLLLLKEQCPHGEFSNRCERLGIEGSLARRLMQVSAKFGKRAISHVLENFGKSKLLELVVLDDEEIEELAEGGTVRGYTADEYDKMSIREMRAALRRGKLEADSDKAATDKVLASKSSEITKLQKKVAELQLLNGQKIVADTDWPDALKPITDQIAAAGREATKALSDLETCRIQIFAFVNDLPEEVATPFQAALAHVSEVYDQALFTLERKVSEERAIFDKTLGCFDE